MRKSRAIFSMLAASLILSALPVLSAETMNTGASKDECLLVAMNCRDSVDSIQQRIDRLSKEIAKGSAVYSAEELGRLNSKLNDATRLYRMMVNEPTTTS